MHSYSVADVEKLLRLPRRTIRALVAAGFVSPQRGPRKTLRFSFQDLILLRTAQSLAAAKVPAQRITRSLMELRRQLPESMPLSGLAIGAVGKRVVVKDGAGRRQVESGQYLLGFEGNPESGSLSVIERAAPSPPEDDADAWFARGASLEQSDADGARTAYEKTIAADQTRLDARINLGRLLHEGGKLANAERVYRDALKVCGDEPLLLFNFGVLLEDLGRKPQAIQVYEAALREDSALADCHYNLALLYEGMKRPKDAIRHMSQYRRLEKK